MYQFGSGYNERRQIMSQNTTSRLYDTFNGVRINIVQVWRSLLTFARWLLFLSH
jgi:hypothetical protein